MNVIDEQRDRIHQLEAEVIAAARCCTDIARTLRAEDHDQLADAVQAIAEHATSTVPAIARINGGTGNCVTHGVHKCPNCEPADAEPSAPDWRCTTCGWDYSSRATACRNRVCPWYGAPRTPETAEPTYHWDPDLGRVLTAPLVEHVIAAARAEPAPTRDERCPCGKWRHTDAMGGGYVACAPTLSKRCIDNDCPMAGCADLAAAQETIARLTAERDAALSDLRMRDVDLATLQDVIDGKVGT